MQLKPIRGFSFWLLIFALVLVMTTTIYGSYLALAEGNPDRRLAALAAVFSGAAFFLALIAVVVALLAYNQSLQRPDLFLDFRMGDGSKGLMVRVVDPPGSNYRQIADENHSMLYMSLRVTNKVSAKSPAVKGTVVKGLESLQAFAADWKPGDDSSSGFRSARWDGGANYLVHGGFPRELPPFVLTRCRLTDKQLASVTLRVEWVADGIDKQSKDLVIALQTGAST